MKANIFALLPAICALALLPAASVHAGSATWSGQLNSNWNVFQNWSPQTVPNGPSDVATLGGSNNRTVYLSANTKVYGITFPKPITPIAVNYGITINPTFALTISGAGITNNSGQAQNFVIAAGDTNVGEAELFFTNSATAGSAIFTNNAPAVTGVDGGVIEFFDNATAGNGTFINNPDGEITFDGSSSAGSGTFTNNGGDAGHFGGSISFAFNATAGTATFTNNGGVGGNGAIYGIVFFTENSTAANAVLINNGSSVTNGGGQTYFTGDSTGGFARVEVFGNGSLDISDHNPPGIAIGSIQGNGIVFLGAINLTTGLNNLSTSFSGVMKDGGFAGGTGGSLTKLGKGKLTLSRGNSYSGGTTVNGGTLVVRNKSGSATGSGVVQVNNGTLGGTGSISNAVTVGNGSAAGAILLGGTSSKSPGTLTINDPLTFNFLSSYTCGLKRTTSGSGGVTAVAGEVSAFGVTINSNVTFTFVDSGSGTLPIGTLFTVINNTSGLPISGRFSNLAQGSTFTSNGNTFKANYTGGSGNDLTLKVVQ
jgi:autotransporter-associated beta strand protein